MTSLAEVIDVVIGVDTHKHTHTAAVVASGTGGELETLTVAADPDGYTALVELAARHGGRRAWAIESTGGYGAGLGFVADVMRRETRGTDLVFSWGGDEVVVVL